MPLLDGVIIGTRVSDSVVGQVYDVEHTPKGVSGPVMVQANRETVAKMRAEKTVAKVGPCLSYYDPVISNLLSGDFI